MRKCSWILLILFLVTIGLMLIALFLPTVRDGVHDGSLINKLTSKFSTTSPTPAPPIINTQPTPVAEAPTASSSAPATLVGNLPMAPLSGEPFTENNMLFGFSDSGSLMTAVHQKTLQILSQGGNLNPMVLRMALRAYACAHAQNIGNQRYLTIIDYSLPSTSKRMWVIDLKTATVSFHTLVAHGKNSGYIYTQDFSNLPSSDATSIGLFLTGDTYTGHNGYSLKLKGLEKGFNDNAMEREVVIHGAAYVSDDFVKNYGRLGRSWGCPALSKLVSTPVINEIKNGTIVFAYYPLPNWITSSTYLHCTVELPWSW